jgi:anti-sigma factor RsiW
VTCRELIEFLDAYLDGSLPPEARVAFDAHLPRCPECRDYLRSYRETIELARRSACQGDEVPAEVPQRLLRAIRAARPGGTAGACGA